MNKTKSTPSPTPSGRLLSAEEIEKLQRKYPCLDFDFTKEEVFSSEVACLLRAQDIKSTALAREEKDEVIHELKVTLFNDSQEIAELKAAHARLMDDFMKEQGANLALKMHIDHIQADYQAKIKELFQEMKMDNSVSSNYIDKERYWSNRIKKYESKYLQGK